MSIEFGIPVVGSTITLQGKFRADTDEEVFMELEEVLSQAARAAGQEMDMHGAASFEGAGLRRLIEHVAAWRPHTGASEQAVEFMTQLLRIAQHAESSGQPVLYSGL